MREILFRGKRKDNGEWVEGYLLRTKDYLYGADHYFLFDDATAFPTGEFLGYAEVDPATVGQYTGLTDKNGVKIFEGDVFHHPSNLKSIYIVSWNERGGFTIFTDDAGFNPKRIEIIGNIHGDSELLEEDDMSDWISVKDRLPENGIVVRTKIDDENGIRNEGKLKRCRNLWFLPDGSMYMYYTPTHWMPLLEPPKEESNEG